MKKYIIAVFSLICLFNLAQAADFSDDITFDKDNIKQTYKQDLQKISNSLEQEITAKENLFTTKRVKGMCKEWFSCVEWAESKLAKDPTFQVVDTEVERWISKWDGDKAVWKYKFYVKTKEQGKTKVYLFARGDKNFSYSSPILIKKFPGHPIANKPSKHITHSEYNDFAFYTFSAQQLCNVWSGCKTWSKDHSLRRAIVGQYIYKYDEQQRPLWQIILYVEYQIPKNVIWFTEKVVYFQAYQTESGGEYTYQGPIETDKSFPLPSNLRIF